MVQNVIDELQAILDALDPTMLEHPNGSVVCDDGSACPALPIVPGSLQIQVVEIQSNGEPYSLIITMDYSL